MPQHDIPIEMKYHGLRDWLPMRVPKATEAWFIDWASCISCFEVNHGKSFDSHPALCLIMLGSLGSTWCDWVAARPAAVSTVVGHDPAAAAAAPTRLQLNTCAPTWLMTFHEEQKSARQQDDPLHCTFLLLYPPKKDWTCSIDSKSRL